MAGYGALMSLKRWSHVTFNDNYNTPAYHTTPIVITGNPALDRFLKILKPKPVKNAPDNYRMPPGSWETAMDTLREVNREDWIELERTLKYDLFDSTHLTIHHPNHHTTLISLRLTSHILSLFSSLTSVSQQTKELINSLTLTTQCQLHLAKNTYSTTTQIHSYPPTSSSRSSRNSSYSDQDLPPPIPLPGVVIQVEKLRPFDSFIEKADQLLHNGAGDIKLFIGINLGSSLDLSPMVREKNRFSTFSFSGFEGRENSKKDENGRNTLIKLDWSLFQMRYEGKSGGGGRESGFGGGLRVRLGDLGREEVLWREFPGCDLGTVVVVEREKIEAIMAEVERDWEGTKWSMGSQWDGAVE